MFQTSMLLYKRFVCPAEMKVSGVLAFVSRTSAKFSERFCPKHHYGYLFASLWFMVRKFMVHQPTTTNQSPTNHQPTTNISISYPGSYPSTSGISTSSGTGLDLVALISPLISPPSSRKNQLGKPLAPCAWGRAPQSDSQPIAVEQI